MKRLYMLLLAICLTFPVLSATAPAAYAAGTNTVILFEGSEQSAGEVKIDVNVIENAGVYAMLLTLDYDETAMTLTNVDYGEAFASLDPIASGDLSTRPFKFNYLGTNKQNDTSTGRMMTLTFAVNENVSDGEYTVKFVYQRNKDVGYLHNGELQTKNLIVNGTKLTLKGSVIDEIETLPDDSAEPTDNNGTVNGTANGANIGAVNGAVIGAVVAGSVVGAGVIALSVMLIVRRKKRKWGKV